MYAAAAFVALASLARAQDLVSFPATGDLSVVFPQNDTYAVVSPFPIIFGFKNSPVLLSFPTKLSWEVSCEEKTIRGFGHIEGERSMPTAADPFYFINVTTAGGDYLKNGNSFPLWRNIEKDQCTLSFEFFYYTNCTEREDGSTLIGGGTFRTVKRTTGFTLKPGAKTPQDAIKNYKGCALSGLAVEVESNMTGCAHMANPALPEPKPCELDVKAAASSLAAAIPTPTTTLTEEKATASSSSSNSPTTTGQSSGGGESGDGTKKDDEDSTAINLSSQGSLLTILAAIGSSLTTLLFL